VSAADAVRVGVIGGSAEGGWASITHLPAIAALEGFVLAAVSTTREESARLASERFGPCLTYTNAAALAHSPDVDLVVVSIKTTEHAAAVAAAIDAGKAVLCEWPLTPSVGEAEALSLSAERRGVRTFVGLQGYASAAMRHAARLVEEDFLGSLLSATLHASTSHFGAITTARNAYSLDRRNGANLLTIIAGHALDMMVHLTGELASAAAIVTNRRTVSTLVETNETVEMTSPDQIAINGILASGAVASIHVHGGTVEPHRFCLELHGTRGTLRLSSDAVAEIMPLRLEGSHAPGLPLAAMESSRFEHDIPAGLRSGPAANVAALYADIRRDLRDGSRLAPDFAIALRRKRMLAALEGAASATLVDLK
jgi:predicted dehydrogenase